jgi:hypothetical protein
MASTTDVRAWLKEQGVDVADRGKLKREHHDAYDAYRAQSTAGWPVAHVPGDPAILLAEDDYDQGVTAADFITADDPPGPPAESAPAVAEDHADERRPRAVASTRRPRRTFRERVWGGEGTKAKRPPAKHKRVSLRGLAEDAFLDAAWTFQALPPIEKILYLQAPMAGVVIEDSIRGTALDRLAQPVARADQKFKAIEGLSAVLWVAGIMLRGRRDESGEYSPETKLMFSGLRHALLSMTRTVERFDFEAQKAKADELRSASGQIDAMIAYIFEMPELTEDQIKAMAEQQAAHAQANGQ